MRSRQRRAANLPDRSAEALDEMGRDRCRFYLMFMLFVCVFVCLCVCVCLLLLFIYLLFLCLGGSSPSPWCCGQCSMQRALFVSADIATNEMTSQLLMLPPCLLSCTAVTTNAMTLAIIGITTVTSLAGSSIGADAAATAAIAARGCCWRLSAAARGGCQGSWRFAGHAPVPQPWGCGSGRTDGGCPCPRPRSRSSSEALRMIFACGQ